MQRLQSKSEDTIQLLRLFDLNVAVICNYWAFYEKQKS